METILLLIFIDRIYRSMRYRFLPGNDDYAVGILIPQMYILCTVRPGLLVRITATLAIEWFVPYSEHLPV